jgi:hypothetical protein
MAGEMRGAHRRQPPPPPDGSHCLYHSSPGHTNKPPASERTLHELLLAAAVGEVVLGAELLELHQVHAVVPAPRYQP